MKVRIYKPSKAATQSGRKSNFSRGNTWVLEFPRQSPVNPDRLMGWHSSSDTARQVRMRFPDRASAVAYAEANGLQFQVNEPNNRRIKPRSYADNFSTSRVGSWTH